VENRHRGLPGDLPHLFAGAIRRTVVGDNDLIRQPGLVQGARQHQSQGFLPVISCNDQRDAQKTFPILSLVCNNPAIQLLMQSCYPAPGIILCSDTGGLPEPPTQIPILKLPQQGGEL